MGQDWKMDPFDKEGMIESKCNFSSFSFFTRINYFVNINSFIIIPLLYYNSNYFKIFFISNNISIIFLHDSHLKKNTLNLKSWYNKINILSIFIIRIKSYKILHEYTLYSHNALDSRGWKSCGRVKNRIKIRARFSMPFFSRATRFEE